jgi:hypothetical protein
VFAIPTAEIKGIGLKDEARRNNNVSHINYVFTGKVFILF